MKTSPINKIGWEHSKNQMRKLSKKNSKEVPESKRFCKAFLETILKTWEFKLPYCEDPECIDCQKGLVKYIRKKYTMKPLPYLKVRSAYNFNVAQVMLGERG